nr:ATP-binding protein [Streptomyces spinoverrucosus]
MPAAGGRRPRLPWRRGPHPRGPLPLPQVAGGLRLRPPAVRQTRDHAHLGTLDFVVGKENAIFLGPPGTGKTHLATGLGIRACRAGQGRQLPHAAATSDGFPPPTPGNDQHQLTA